MQVPRDYDRTPSAGPGDADRFADAVVEYRAQVLRVDVADIAATVAGADPLGRAWWSCRRICPPTGCADLDVIRDSVENPLGVTELDRADAVVTGCALGIAATGTIVLDGGAAQGRRALTLVPDHHVCVVFTDQIVDSVPQAFAALDPLRPLTFISGPSATSDIELDRVEGVHGPRTLDVLLVRR